jgi:glutamyl-tRNA synthetase
VGHALTFFTAAERACLAGGKLILRMEDLDPDRSRAEFAEAALEDLRWLGLHWDEGPDIGGPFNPYVQSKRHKIYLAVWRKLLQSRYIYPCRCSRKDLAAALNAPHESARTQPDPLDDEPVYPGTCRPAQSVPAPAAVELENPEGFNWRFRVPDGEAIEFKDLNLGPQRFIVGRDFGDFVVWRRDGIPSYQLACVADDSTMGITEVVRGADLLKSTARQILLNQALGFINPEWFHCSLVLDEKGQRLAKRHDASSIRTLRQRGFRPSEVLAIKTS